MISSEIPTVLMHPNPACNEMSAAKISEYNTVRFELYHIKYDLILGDARDFHRRCFLLQDMVHII